jgi:hypothetical protein
MWRTTLVLALRSIRRNLLRSFPRRQGPVIRRSICCPSCSRPPLACYLVTFRPGGRRGWIRFRR